VATEVSNLRMVLRLLVAFIVMSAAFFGSAGTVAWPQAWIYMIIQFSFWTVTALWLKKHNPQLLKDRMVFLKPRTRGWDKTIIMTSTAVFVPYLLCRGSMQFDTNGHRFRYSSQCSPTQESWFHYCCFLQSCEKMPTCRGLWRSKRKEAIKSSPRDPTGMFAIPCTSV